MNPETRIKSFSGCYHLYYHKKYERLLKIATKNDGFFKIAFEYTVKIDTYKYKMIQAKT